MTWTCEAFDRWLDEGRPERGEARAHATDCVRCARSLAAAMAIDEALALPAVAHAAPDFTDEVMRRARAARAFTRAPSLAWWVRVWAEPAAAGACVLIAIVAWRGADLRALGLEASAALALWSHAASDTVGSVTAVRALTSPLVVVGWAPALCVASWWLFRWSERFIARRMVPTR